MLQWRGTRQAFSRATLTDARGREVPLLDGPTRADWKRFSWWRRSRAVQLAGEPWMTELRVQSRAGMFYGAVLGIMFALTRPLVDRYFTPAFSSFPGPLAYLLPASIVGVMGWPLYGVVVRLLRRERRGELLRAYLSAGLCPSCSHPLAGLAPADDGALVCPECGAAWKPSQS